MLFTKFLALLLVLPLSSHAAKKPKKSKKPLPACLLELNQQSDSLMESYQKLAQHFPINERTRPAIYHGIEPGMDKLIDGNNRRILEDFMGRWFAEQRGWKRWDTYQDLQKMGDFPLIAGIVRVERDAPTEHNEATIGFHASGGPVVVSRSYIGIVDHFDPQDNRVYVREIAGSNQGNIIGIDVDAPDFIAYLHKAPKSKR